MACEDGFRPRNFTLPVPIMPQRPRQGFVCSIAASFPHVVNPPDIISAVRVIPTEGRNLAVCVRRAKSNETSPWLARLGLERIPADRETCGAFVCSVGVNDFDCAVIHFEA